MLANLKIRAKLLVALLPLVVVVIAAVTYSSLHMATADTQYTLLLDKDVMAARSLTLARSHVNRFGKFLYEELSERDPVRIRELDSGLDQLAGDFHSTTDQAMRSNPAAADSIQEVRDSFDHAVSDSRRVRAFVFSGDTAAALSLTQGTVDPELEQVRNAMARLVDGLERSIDRQSDDLTVQMHRALSITWVLISLGIAGSLLFAIYVLQHEVVDLLEVFRIRILDVAEDRCDEPIPNLERTDEVGEMSRALHTLQRLAQERQIQAWIKTEVAATSERLQSAENFREFAGTLLSRISESIELLYGAFYLADPNQERFTRVGGFAGASTAEPESFAMGEGLVGQAAAERRTLEVTTTAENRLQISAGISAVTPQYLYFLPVAAHGEVSAVVELAPLHPLSPRQKALLDAMLPTVALSTEIPHRQYRNEEAAGTHQGSNT